MLEQWDLYNIIVKICHTAIVFSVNDSIHGPHQIPNRKHKLDVSNKPTVQYILIVFKTAKQKFDKIIS